MVFLFIQVDAGFNYDEDITDAKGLISNVRVLRPDMPGASSMDSLDSLDSRRVCLKIEESCKEKLHWWCHLVKFTLASPSPVLLATTPPNERGPLEADLDRHARLTILYLVDKKSFVVISPKIVIRLPT